MFLLQLKCSYSHKTPFICIYIYIWWKHCNKGLYWSCCKHLPHSSVWAVSISSESDETNRRFTGVTTARGSPLRGVPQVQPVTVYVLSRAGHGLVRPSLLWVLARCESLILIQISRGQSICAQKRNNVDVNVFSLHFRLDLALKYEIYIYIQQYN